MKKTLKLTILCMAFMLVFAVCTFAAEFVLTSEIPDEITISDAKTEPFTVSGTYEANTEISLQIKNTETGKVVLYQQSQTDENGAFTISGTMSNDVTTGRYEVKLGATNMTEAKDYYFDTIAVTNEAVITIKVAGGSANVLVDGVDKGSALFVATYPVGTALTYTAVPEDENQTFLYWYDAESKAILSTGETIEVTVGSDAEYVAVYADKTKDIYVTFKSNKRILAAGLKGAIDIPADPYVAGYTFAGWYDENGKPTTATLDVSENTVYTAGFKANTTKYTVTVTGAEEEGGEYAYNEKVTLNAKEPEEGLVFTHWTRDGETVSYSKTYSFYVSADTTVTANYSETALEEQIVLVMANPTVVGTSSDKIAFYAERNIPEKYTVVETGILVSQANSFDINSAGIIKAKATSTANIGQYTIRKANVKSGETWNAKAYLIYTYEGETYAVYSDMVSKAI